MISADLVPCPWCGTPDAAAGHPACRPAPAIPRRPGDKPLWAYGPLDPRWRAQAYAEIERVEGDRVAGIAFAWATEQGWPSELVAEWSVLAGEAMRELVRAEAAEGLPDWHERQAILCQVADELAWLAAHRAPDGTPYEGLVA